jgi:hypothetical protein
VNIQKGAGRKKKQRERERELINKSEKEKEKNFFGCCIRQRPNINAFFSPLQLTSPVRPYKRISFCFFGQHQVSFSVRRLYVDDILFLGLRLADNRIPFGSGYAPPGVLPGLVVIH